MQIDNLLHDEPHDVEAQLRQRVSGENPIDDCRTRLLLELVQHLRRQGSGPRAFGLIVGDELWLSPARAANLVLVKVRVDWHDQGPSRDGVPVMHYRLQFRRGKAGLSTDARAESPEDAEQVVWEAFGWKR
jgi:hypothetical protein